MILLELFISFLKIGFFSFGGGLAALALIEKEVVVHHGWLTSEEFLGLVTVSEMSPGPIGINAATFAGYRMGGVPGSLVATATFCLPSVLLVLLAYRFFTRFKHSPPVQYVLAGMRPALVALIALAAVSIGQRGIKDPFAGIVAGLCFFLFSRKKLDPILILLVAGIVGMVFYRE